MGNSFLERKFNNSSSAHNTNTEARSCKYCCSAKAITVTYSEYVF